MRKWHVVPYGKEWVIRADGNTKVSEIYSRRAEAIDAALTYVDFKNKYVIVHCRTGRIFRG